MDIFYEILKWVLVILIAGFIGQFGKSLSLYLLNKSKKKKDQSKEVSSDPKAQKKAYKAWLKAKKKNNA